MEKIVLANMKLYSASSGSPSNPSKPGIVAAIKKPVFWKSTCGGWRELF